MTVQVKGLKELQKALIEIGSVSGTNAMRSSMFTASKPIVERGKANAPKASGALAEAVSRTFAVKTNGGNLLYGDEAGSTFVIIVGPKVKNRVAIALYNLVHKRKRPRRGIFHGHFPEWGTKAGMQAMHWLRNALEATAPQATARLAEVLKKRIETAARKR